MTITTDHPVDNGVDTAALLGAREALSTAPEAAEFTWRSTTQWVHGTHSRSTVTGFSGLGQEQTHQTSFTFDADHPACFASQDLGATPVEIVLSALGSCLTAGVAAVAQHRGIQLRSVTANVEATMNVLGILGADPDVRNGFGGVTVRFDIDADATDEELAAVVAQSQKRSAVFDIMTNPTSVVVADGAREPIPMPRDVTTVIIGAGHAGLAMSQRLTERSIDHVVLERGEVASSWRTERWDSLRLLTPNWHTRLPGLTELGEPDGFMTMPEVVALIGGYARTLGAPVLPHTRVVRVAVGVDGYTVATDRGTWRCASVVLATGPANVAAVPPFASSLPRSVASITPLTYRSPAQLADRGVLVVGGSASGVQLADEIHRSGRPVTLAVGEHVRMPRTYRGHDIFWWLDAAGVLDERHDQVDDLVRARHVPSPQLVGTPDGRSIDLNTLTELGVDIVGRVGAVRDGVALCSGALANVCRLADLKLGRLLDRLDRWADRAGPAIGHDAERPAPSSVPSEPTLELDLHRRGIGTVVWATGFRPDHSWLHVPVFDHRGRIRHHGGVVHGAPGIYLLGGNLLRTRRSSYIGGAGDDTHAIAEHLHLHLASARRMPSSAAAGS